MISEDAPELVDRLAHEIGFGSSDDYPHRGESAISAGDRNGSGIVACVFAHDDHARRWVQACKENLAAVDDREAAVVPHPRNGLCVAMISGIEKPSRAMRPLFGMAAADARIRPGHAAAGTYSDGHTVASAMVSVRDFTRWRCSYL